MALVTNVLAFRMYSIEFQIRVCSDHFAVHYMGNSERANTHALSNGGGEGGRERRSKRKKSQKTIL